MVRAAQPNAEVDLPRSNNQKERRPWQTSHVMRGRPHRHLVRGSKRLNKMTVSFCPSGVLHWAKTQKFLWSWSPLRMNTFLRTPETALLRLIWLSANAPQGVNFYAAMTRAINGFIENNGNRTVLLHERKRHTARRESSTPSWGTRKGMWDQSLGYPPPPQKEYGTSGSIMGLRWGNPPPRCGQAHTCETVPSRCTTYAGGNKWSRSGIRLQPILEQLHWFQWELYR